MMPDGNMEVNGTTKGNGKGEYVGKHKRIPITQIKRIVIFWGSKYTIKMFEKNSKKMGKK